MNVTNGEQSSLSGSPVILSSDLSSIIDQLHSVRTTDSQIEPRISSVPSPGSSSHIPFTTTKHSDNNSPRPSSRRYHQPLSNIETAEFYSSAKPFILETSRQSRVHDSGNGSPARFDRAFSRLLYGSVHRRSHHHKQQSFSDPVR